MGVYKPKEVLVDGTDGCGLVVDVALVGEEFEAIETEYDTSAFSKTVSPDGEGMHVPTGETAVYIRATSVASRIACNKCGICVEEVLETADYSIKLDGAVYLPLEGDQDRVVGLEVTYAESVMDMSGVRDLAKLCANRNRMQLPTDS